MLDRADVHENVEASLEAAKSELIAFRTRVAMLFGAVLYPLHAFGDWFEFKDWVAVEIRLGTTVLILLLSSLFFTKWGRRHCLALVSVAFLVAVAGFQWIIGYERAFNTVYSDGFDQFYATYCVLIPATTRQTAMMGIAFIALSIAPQMLITGTVTDGGLIALSYATNFSIFLVGRHIANQLWEREFRARQESESFYKRLVQSEKMAALGRLAAGIAHELNNPLAIVGSNVEQIQRSVARLAAAADADDVSSIHASLRRAVERLHLGTERMIAVNQLLRQYISSPQQDLRMADIGEILNLAVALVEPKASAKGITLHRKWDQGITLLCDPQSLSHVFVNLFENACDELPPSGNIWIQSKVQEDGSLMILIRDDGPGFPDVVRSRFGEPFLTTKEPGLGTGLGLAICKTIVEKHAGKLEIQNRESGAEVIITFQSSSLASKGLPASSPAPQQPS